MTRNTYPNLFRFADTLNQEWNANGKIDWQEAEDLIAMIRGMASSDRGQLAKVLAYTDETEDWDSENVICWPSLVTEHLTETIVRFELSPVESHWELSRVQLSGEKTWLASTASEDAALAIINFYDEPTEG